METLHSIESFVRSAECGSFSEAARRLGMTPAAVSKNIAKLEAAVGVRLFQRSTRSLKLTESGEKFLREVAGGLSAIQNAVANLSANDQKPAGTLRVSMSVAFGRDYILPLLGEFLALYPAVVPDWHFEARQVDLIGEGFDAGIGASIDLSSGLVARELARVHWVVVASRSYLERHRAPKSPADLAEHDGILMRSPQSGRLRNFTLTNRRGEQRAVELRPRIIFNDPETLANAAIAGLGVALVPMAHAVDALEAGKLVRLLPDWHCDMGPIALYFAKGKLLPAKTRAFVDFIVAQFRKKRLAARLSAIAN